MEKNSVIAKNLLEGKTCDNCEHSFRGSCKYCNNIDEPASITSLPKDNTCSKWKERKYNKVINVRWTKEAEIDLSTYYGLDAEDEIVEKASEAMQEEIEEEIEEEEVITRIKDKKIGK